MIQVVNKYKTEPTDHDIYIGRGSPLGNPYSSMKDKKTLAAYVCDTREESIEMYEKYLRKRIKERNSDICDELRRIHNLSKNHDINLVCFCKPKPCHGDIILKILKLLR